MISSEEKEALTLEIKNRLPVLKEIDDTREGVEGFNFYDYPDVITIPSQSVVLLTDPNLMHSCDGPTEYQYMWDVIYHLLDMKVDNYKQQLSFDKDNGSLDRLCKDTRKVELIELTAHLDSIFIDIENMKAFYHNNKHKYVMMNERTLNKIRKAYYQDSALDESIISRYVSDDELIIFQPSSFCFRVVNRDVHILMVGDEMRLGRFEYLDTKEQTKVIRVKLV